MNDSVRGNAIRNSNGGETVNLDVDVSSVACYVDRQRLILEKGLEIDLSREG